MLIFKEFSFDSAHYLPNVPLTHKCREMHGHTYRLTVFLEGRPNMETGWIIDFADLKKIVNKTLAIIDHKCLNTVTGLENPTCEMLAIWIWDRLKKELPILSEIQLYETITSGVVYSGD
jgi:6-pyruvoyltetrahydropterin/6-carboxytetrahydropterin synthase